MSDPFSTPFFDSDAARLESICLRFEEALTQGERPSIADLLSIVPDGNRNELLIELLLLEFRWLNSQGCLVDRDEYEARFPDRLSQVNEACDIFQNSPTKQCVGDDSARSRSAAADSDFDSPVPPSIGRFDILRKLGDGGFGEVYLGCDPTLHRQVALKIPKPSHASVESSELEFIDEARKLVHVQGPGIAIVHEVFPVTLAGQRRICIVQQFIDGKNLAEWRAAQPKPIAVDRIAQLMAEIATILSSIHRQDFVHRDLKPANIMIDNADRPYVLDFGLAIRESQRLERLGVLEGTMPYMSPEQVRGETHRMDDRSDIWSLGVIMYELFSGRRPFHGDRSRDLFSAIQTWEPRPLRQLVENFPPVLDLICLKCLNKQKSDRYTTMAELASDLRSWRDTASAIPLSMGRVGDLTWSGFMPASAAGKDTGHSADLSVNAANSRVIPRGLRAFTEEDGDWYLQLLPGVRERNGLPESIDFWKRRIESSAAEYRVPVGLVFGPSGCGKSSLIRAGLLPRLESRVVAIYLEATQEGTERQLLSKMRERLPAIPAGLGLREIFEGLRYHRWKKPDEKVLIVLDQFEQWLYAHQECWGEELADALRQCDGCGVQAILLVSDGFWSPIFDFMKALDIDLAERKNCRKVSLFDKKHAKKVLALFGQAYEQIGQGSESLTAGENAFLDAAVAALAERGKVVSVRLALFAELMQEGPWTLSTLEAHGGVKGVGVAFLKESFDSRDISPLRKRHADAAWRVLQSLLPPPGTEIRVHSRTEKELAAAARYTDRPADHAELLRLLDDELRLITPAFADQQKAVGYQLTHDYLVSPLREWIESKRRKTRSGRAELTLDERASTWIAEPTNRNLPSLVEFLRIVTFTSSRQWTAPQRRAMARACWMHARNAGFLLAFFLLTIFATATVLMPKLVAMLMGVPAVQWEREMRVNAAAAFLDYVPSLAHRDWTRPELASFTRQLVSSPPDHQLWLRDKLRPLRKHLVEPLQCVFDGKELDDGDVRGGRTNDNAWNKQQRLAAAETLLDYCDDDLIRIDLLLRSSHGQFAAMYPWFAAKHDRTFAERLHHAALHLPDSFGNAASRSERGRRVANAVTMLLIIKDVKRSLSLLDNVHDPEALSQFVAGCRLRGVSIECLLESLDVVLLNPERYPRDSRYAILLALGDFALKDVPSERVPRLREQLIGLYRNDPSSGVHSAVGWLLRQWGFSSQVSAVDRMRVDYSPGREWFTIVIDPPRDHVAGGTEFKKVLCFTFIVFSGLDARLGTLPDDPDKASFGPDELAREVKITRPFAILDREVTMEEMIVFDREIIGKLANRTIPDGYSSWSDTGGTRQLPLNPACFSVKWYDAIRFCRWLSTAYRLPEMEHAYPSMDTLSESEFPRDPEDGGRAARNWPIRPGASGFRLPTDAEFEVANRCGANTDFSFGNDRSLLDQYAWHKANSEGHVHEPKERRPNRRGLFDLAGNVWEWTHDWSKSFDAEAKIFIDPIGPTVGEKRATRGGGYDASIRGCRAARRASTEPFKEIANLGFRLAMWLETNQFEPAKSLDGDR